MGTHTVWHTGCPNFGLGCIGRARKESKKLSGQGPTTGGATTWAGKDHAGYQLTKEAFGGAVRSLPQAVQPPGHGSGQPRITELLLLPNPDAERLAPPHGYGHVWQASPQLDQRWSKGLTRPQVNSCDTGDL